MQANLERGKAPSGARSGGPFVAIWAGVSIITTLTLCAPDRALAACVATHPVISAPAGGGGVHSAAARPSTSGGGGGGGGGSLGCPNGSSAPALHGLPVAASGRVIEPNVRSAVHTATYTRTATTKIATAATRAALTGIANASAHFGAAIKPPRAVVRR